jgi:hypothetical protein
MADRYWRGGSGTWNGTSTTNWSTTSGGASGASVPTSADNVIFDANSNTGTGSFTVTMATVTAVCADFTATGVDGTMTLAGSVGLTIYGSLALPATLFTRSFTGTLTFAATTTGKTISANGKNFGTIIFDGVGGGWTLSNALTATSNITLTNGSLNLGGFTLSCFGFNTNNSNTRTLAFNGGSISITGNSNTSNQTLWNSPTLTNLTVTGTPTVNVINTSTNSGFTRSFNHGNTAGGSEATAITLNIQAGDTGNLLTVSGYFLNLSFTGCSSTLSNNSRAVYGNLTLSSSMVLTAGTNTTTFASTSGTVRTITTANQTLDFPIAFSGVGGSWQLQDNLTLGATRGIGLNNGTFDSNNKNISCGIFTYNNSNTKSLTLGTSVITIAGGTSTTGFVGTSSNTTYSATNATVIFTSTGAYSNGSTASGNQVGAVVMGASGGTLYLGNSSATGARCTTLGNTQGQPCTITNTCTTAFVVGNFAVTGSSGNVVTINSDIAGTARTISQTSGTIDATYLTIQDSTVSGGATWNAYVSTNTSNNTGWNFVTAKTTAVYTATGTFTVPAGVTSITVEAIGGGGYASNNTGFGAGGGAYAKSNAIAVTPGNTFYINIGAGADSWANTVNSAPTVGVTPTTQAVLAKAGASSASTGLGGQASLSIGDVKYNGGNGGTSQRNNISSIYGIGGSGGAAGPYGAGGNGGDAFTSTTLPNTGGGGGGAGAFSSSAGGGAGYVPTNSSAGGNGGSSASGLLGGLGVANNNGSDGVNGGGGGGGGFDIAAPLAYAGGSGSTAAVPLWSISGTSYGPGSGGGGGSAYGTVDFNVSGAGGNYGGGGSSGSVSGIVVITYTSGGSSISVSITEAASGIDSILAQIIAESAINESAAGLDSLTTQLVTTGTISEASSGLDALTTTATLNSALSEAASGLDSLTTTATLNTDISEASSGLDALTTTATLNLAIAEAASGVDAIISTATLSVAIAEAASGLDATSLQLQISLSISEAASGVDSSIAGSVFVASIVEAVSGQDTLTTQLQAINAILEAAAGVDGVLTSAVLNIAVVESATGSAVFDAAFLWNLIDDAQNAGWSLIDDGQTVTWTLLDNAQTVTWVLVNNNPNAT